MLQLGYSSVLFVKQRKIHPWGVRAVQSSSVTQLNVQLFGTPWTAAHQASLSITNSRSLLKLMSIESVMATQKKRGAHFWLLFLYVFFLLPVSLPYVNWISKEGCLFHLRFSFQSSDLPLIYFHGFFLSLSFTHHYFALLFPILTT